MNIQIWTKNGTVWPTSRYLTFNAESQISMARAVKIARRTSRGRARIPQVGEVPNQTIIPVKMPNATAKSATGDKTPDSGRMRRGKENFQTRCVLSTTLALPRVKAPAKRFHGNRAEKIKIG